MTESTTVPVGATPNYAKAIKMLMEKDGGPKVSMTEFKALTTEERKELGELCIAELARQGITV